MKINFTKKQYEDLVKLAYLGTWMINAFRTDDTVEKYEELEQYIFSFFKDFEMEKYIMFDEELKMFFPTKEFEENTDVEQYIDEYNNDIFWDELIYRLARRDLIREYGEENVIDMTLEELIEKEEPFIEKYDEEFAKNGIYNLEIKDKIGMDF
jgi:hypothetical protein